MKADNSIYIKYQIHLRPSRKTGFIPPLPLLLPFLNLGRKENLDILEYSQHDLELQRVSG